MDCRFPFCSPCPYIWLQTGLLCPWIDWILHTVLNCAFNWTQLHEWCQSPLKPPRAPFWPSVVKFGWLKHLTIWSPAAVSARKDSGVPAHESGSTVLYQPKTIPHFHLSITWMASLWAFISTWEWWEALGKTTTCDQYLLMAPTQGGSKHLQEQEPAQFPKKAGERQQECWWIPAQLPKHAPALNTESFEENKFYSALEDEHFCTPRDCRHDEQVACCPRGKETKQKLNRNCPIDSLSPRAGGEREASFSL